MVFLGYYIVLAFLLSLILWLAETYAGLTIGSNSVSAVPYAVAALQAGQRYGARTGERPADGYAWWASSWFVLASTVASAGIIWGQIGRAHV